MRVGFIGLGKMGLPMATNLAKAGQDLIVYDLDRSVVDAFVAEHDARPANGLTSVAENADIVITIVPTGKDVRTIALGDGQGDGLAANMGKGKLLLDMSSSDPTGTVALAAMLAEGGIALVDAPVSGGVTRATDGSLAIMVGGGAADVDRCRPLLDIMGGQIFECGGVGAGHAMKALNNMLSAIGLAAAGEALLIGKQFGLDPAVMVDTLNRSTGRNNATEVKFHQFVLNGTYGSGFTNGLMVKDLTTAQDLARASEVPAPFTALVREFFEAARKQYGNGSDHTEVVRWQQEVAKLALAGD
jgi:3-hydroxyisobutyrate dehydrogenase